MAGSVDSSSVGRPEDRPYDKYFSDQFEQLNNWSRYYHDAEIKVNGTALLLSAISALVGLAGGPKNFEISGGHSLIGLIIAVISFAALISTIGYWRYYELTDLMAKKFREQYIPRSVIDPINKKIRKTFRREFPYLSSSLFVHAHHAVWIVIQSVLLIVGIYVFAMGIPSAPG